MSVARVKHLREPHDSCGGQWVFKESAPNRKKRAPTEQRWRNSGGAKGSRTLPAGGDDQIRRRYGRINQTSTP